MTADMGVGLAIGLVIGILGTLVFLEVFFDTGPSEILRGGRRTVRKVHEHEHWGTEAEPAEAPARLIDPNDPPTWRVYSPTGERPPLHCHCHGDPFEPNQPVLWWPVPDGEDGQVELLCEEGVGMKAPTTL
jgi:hypothetical protein